MRDVCWDLACYPRQNPELPNAWNSPANRGKLRSGRQAAATVCLGGGDGSVLPNESRIAKRAIHNLIIKVGNQKYYDCTEQPGGWWLPINID